MIVSRSGIQDSVFWWPCRIGIGGKEVLTTRKGFPIVADSGNIKLELGNRGVSSVGRAKFQFFLEVPDICKD